MELLFRKYFWVVNLVFLLCAAYFGAKTVNTFVGARLAPKPDFGSAPPPVIATSKPKTALTAENLSKVTGIELPKPPPEATPGAPGSAAAAPGMASFDDQTPVKSGLRVRLVGTMVANRKQWSMANIEDVTSHDIKVYMVGDQIQGAQVIDIERWRVLVNNAGRKEFIDNEAGDGSAPVAAIAPQPNIPPPSGPSGEGIKRVGDNTYEVSKDVINGALTDLNKIAMDARIVPAFKDGVATGFKLFSIRPDSLYSKIGIQNGDVVRRINGYEINSPDKALEVYSKLKEAGRIEIELERNGAVQRSTYNVK